MREGYLRGSLARPATPRQIGVLAAFVAAGGSVSLAAALVGIRPSTAKRHLADLRARSGMSTEQLIYAGAVGGWLSVPSLLGDFDISSSGSYRRRHQVGAIPSGVDPGS